MEDGYENLAWPTAMHYMVVHLIPLVAVIKGGYNCAALEVKQLSCYKQQFLKLK